MLYIMQGTGERRQRNAAASGARERRMCPSVRRGGKRGGGGRGTVPGYAFRRMLLLSADPRTGNGGASAAGTGDPHHRRTSRLEEMGFGICEGTTDFQDNPDNPIYPLFHRAGDLSNPGGGRREP